MGQAERLQQRPVYREHRASLVVGADGELLLTALLQVAPRWDARRGVLALRFPDGSEVAEETVCTKLSQDGFDDGRCTTADDFKNCRRTDRGYPFTRVNCPTSEMPRRKKSEHPVR